MHLLRNYLLIVALCTVLCIYSCRQAQKKDSVQTRKILRENVVGNFSSQSYSTFDSAAIDSFLLTYPLFRPYQDDMRRFYRHRQYAYAWFEGDTLIEHAGNLANLLADMDNEGLYSRPPYLEKTDSLLHLPSVKKEAKTLELMLTAQYFAYAKMAWEGMDKKESISNQWFLPRKRLPYDLYLDSLLKTDGKGQQVTVPVYRQYELLKTFLKKYRELEKQGDWPMIAVANTTGSAIAPESVKQLRKRLYALGDFVGDTAASTLDQPLTLALQNFQERHGITASGKVDGQTLKELNQPLKTRITQLIVNMERSRWLPVAEQGEYIAVNIPEFKLHYYRQDSLLWSCNVVVGKTMNRTTIFHGQISQVVFSPYWNVPESIVRDEIVPGMKKQANFLQSHDMEVTGTKNGLPIVRQRPGKSNSLGLVKFLFPNSYHIYLHDTPSKSLFNESKRAFSHGCIRVAEPALLARFLLRGNDEWTTEKIEKAMHAGKERSVGVKETTPVFIAYFTAFVDRSNRLNFRKDVYQMDDRLATMIMSGKGRY